MPPVALDGPLEGLIARSCLEPRRPEHDLWPATGQNPCIGIGANSIASSDFTELYRTHYPRLVRTLELSGADRPRAEDTAQEAFARTLAHWHRVRLGTNPPGYVYTVAFRLARRRRVLEVPVSEEALADSPATGDVASEATLAAGFASALERMPRGRKSVALLCMVAQLSPKEAGKALGIAESTVRKQLERARADLRLGLGD